MAVSKAELKKIKALNTKKGRREENQMAVGGVRLLEEALKSKLQPVRVLYSSAAISPRAERLIGKFKRTGVPLVGISSKELDLISDTESSQGIIAVFEVPVSQLSKLYKPSYRRVLLCDRINDPGNLGTLARSALAFDFDMMMVTDKSAELFSPKVVRASMGAMFTLPAANVSYAELEELKISSGAQVVAAIALGESSNQNLKELDSMLRNDRPIILAVGGEADGLSDEVLKVTDLRVSISQNTKVESLNAAVAGSILMSNIFQRDKE